ncbi:hypothetical protein Tco_0735381 [Tanacetum coccineum]
MQSMKEEGKGDAEMTDAGCDNKTEGPMQSSSVSSDFASQFLNLDNVPPVDNEVVSMMNAKSRIPAMVDAQLSTRLEDSIQNAFWSYTAEFEKKAQGEKKKYIDLVEKSVKDIIKDEVKSQLPHIIPKEVSDFATPVIQSTITESLENVVLDKSSSQPQSSYEAAMSLTKFELKKILLDKMQKSKSYRGAQEHRDLYDGLVKSYNLDKDLFESYGKAYSLKRVCEDKDKDEDPPARSDQRVEKKEDKQGSEESVFETTDTKMLQNQGSDLGNTDDQPNVKAASKHDWFKKPERPPTLDSDWNARKTINFQTTSDLDEQNCQSKKTSSHFRRADERSYRLLNISHEQS